MSTPRDIISITALSLRTPSLQSDLWQRASKSQPLLLSLSIATDVTSEATTDSLLGESLNYGTVTKAIEKAVAQLAPEDEDGDGIALEVLAERLAKVIIFSANAPNVRLELSRPRALLSAESVGVDIFRTKSDYLPPTSNSSPTPADYTLSPSSPNPANDKLFIRSLRRSIIIGVNACERLDEQEVIVDLEFGPPDTDEMLSPYAGTAARSGWRDWRQVVKRVESYLTSSRPLTIEALTTSIAQLILTPPSPPSSTSSAAAPARWNVPRTTVRIAKPCALMFAKYPAVQITRTRADFFPNSAIVRGLSTRAGAGEVRTSLMHTVYVGVGTNMGERVGNISSALRELQKSGTDGGETRVVDTSFLYESEAMYVTEQDKFLNAVVKIETTLAPQTLLARLKDIEATLGRQKTFRNGPRLIDLDILFFDDLVLESRENAEQWLKIPHASIAEREFVLRPLVDLIPSFQHPTLHTPLSTLLNTLLAHTPSTLHRVLPLSSSHTHALASRTLIMSILNTTPDSFSDGGDHTDLPRALEALVRHVQLGADILDVGGMSTRPGAVDVSEEEEIDRVVPLIRAARDAGITTPISIDTFRPGVARAAIAAGANIVNDVLGGTYPGMRAAMAELDVPVVLMHSRGTPGTMGGMTTYEDGDVVKGVREELGERVKEALGEGVRRWNVVVDPGIGFAKTGEQNLVLLKHLREVLGRGSSSSASDTSLNSDTTFLGTFPSLVGASRKKFLAKLTGKESPKERAWATAAAVVVSVVGQVDVVRVHDVEEMVDVVRVADGIWRRP